MNRRWSFPVAAVAAAIACPGCGKSDRIYPVTGTVTYQGAPAAGAFVFLRRPGGDGVDDQSQMGVVKADGSFAIVCGGLGEGAVPGEYDVLIKWPRGPGHHNLPAAKGSHPAGDDRLRGRYADPNHPRLHAVVRAGPNSLPPFELTDAP